MPTPPRGRPFQHGNPGGPGRPKRETERKYLRALIGCVPLKYWKLVVKKALADAAQGDAQARTWLSKYLIGDDPLSLIEVVEELRAELERLRHANGGTAERGAGPAGGGEGTASGGPGGPRLAPLPGTAKRGA
jgi:hypothetical protein